MNYPCYIYFCWLGPKLQHFQLVFHPLCVRRSKAKPSWVKISLAWLEGTDGPLRHRLQLCRNCAASCLELGNSLSFESSFQPPEMLRKFRVMWDDFRNMSVSFVTVVSLSRYKTVFYPFQLSQACIFSTYVCMQAIVFSGPCSGCTNSCFIVFSFSISPPRPPLFACITRKTYILFFKKSIYKVSSIQQSIFSFPCNVRPRFLHKRIRFFP